MSKPLAKRFAAGLRAVGKVIVKDTVWLAIGALMSGFVACATLKLATIAHEDSERPGLDAFSRVVLCARDEKTGTLRAPCYPSSPEKRSQCLHVGGHITNFGRGAAIRVEVLMTWSDAKKEAFLIGPIAGGQGKDFGDDLFADPQAAKNAPNTHFAHYTYVRYDDVDRKTSYLIYRGTGGTPQTIHDDATDRKPLDTEQRSRFTELQRLLDDAKSDEPRVAPDYRKCPQE